ncbi:peptidoglycan editing factor PgeF [Sutcliffiella horikoshii]|uniref:Purine nucleoside phosphorylase n=1 Tax=Sutcliffiella horikoshii TaxID=79883 RepID=A0A5D4T8Y0_9BACI|nr:peptidoglycan editing factor PgeF [Sutcliffiella horikoshii]TYS70676.1 peptidoglycan editing factor PgeF [Sutcliffiella horikoshii]
MTEPFVLEKEQTLSLPVWKGNASNLIVGFTTKNGGVSEGQFSTLNMGLHVNDSVDAVCQNKEILASQLNIPTKNWVGCDQTHEDKIVKVNNPDKGKGVYSYSTALSGTDGIYTDSENILLTLCFADCVPLYFYSKEHSLVGIAHAGWKGTVKNIAGNMINRWMEDGVNIDTIQVAIGPAISAQAYIVDDYVVNRVMDALPGTDKETYMKEVSSGQYALDLKKVNFELLLQAGVSEENILCSSFCTSSNESLFFSHRRDKGKTGRMMSFIGLKGADFE